MVYWERVETRVGDSPSTLRFILPDIFGDDGERLKLLRENMYTALEEDQIVKLTRGFVLTERTLSTGVRRGIVAAIDLEAYSYVHGENAPIRGLEEIDRVRMKALLEQRRSAPLEFPHAVVLYRDKKDKVMRGLLKEDLEQIYDFELMERGGHVRGFFIPDYIARDVALDLHSRTEPCFLVADGGDALAAAKEHWEAVKATIPAAEQRNHPARFALVELVNVCADAAEIQPLHRAVKDIEPEAFCDFLMRSVKCKRRGNAIYPELPMNAESVEKIDALIERFVRANTGRVEYVRGEEALLALVKEADCAGVVLKEIDKEDLFDALKGGRSFPKRTFTLKEARYYLEGREISYD